MGFKEVLQKMKEKKEERKELFRKMQENDKLTTLLNERKKSANQRELERYYKENEESSIKDALEIARKARQDEINFGSNPLNVKNITSHTQWEVLREKNMFNKKSMFKNENIHKSNPHLLKSGNVLHHRSSIFNSHGGRLI